jgi:hypothetical protein
MTVSNELSSEIAAAILVARDKSPQELITLKEIVVRVHTTLQELTDEPTPAKRQDCLPTQSQTNLESIE